jgi:hypothetical protein
LTLLLPLLLVVLLLPILGFTAAIFGCAPALLLELLGRVGAGKGVREGVREGRRSLFTVSTTKTTNKHSLFTVLLPTHHAEHNT